jgi:hypothetical protein
LPGVLNHSGHLCFLVIESCVLQFFIEAGHLRDERNHAVVADFVSRIGEVDGAEWTYLKK